jgi:hypothetical protein
MQEPSLLKLTECLCSLPGAGKARVLVGLPEHWPSTIPILEDMQVVGSVTLNSNVRIFLETQLLPEQVHETYNQALAFQGARPVASHERPIRFYWGDWGLLQVEARRQEGEPVTYAFLQWIPIPMNDLQRTSGGFNRINSLDEISRSLPSSKIPLSVLPLDAPHGYRKMTGSKGSDAQGEFVLFTDITVRDASEVLEHFAQQLARAGWQRVAQAATCITWRVPCPGENSASGVLWVLDSPEQDEQKMVLVRVEQEP